MFGGVFANRTVFMTGHTGFKGSWLAFWLHHLGARVVGFSLDPPTRPSLFEALGLQHLIHHHYGDIRQLSLLKSLIQETNPDFVFHLAAQSLVRPSYQDPIGTFEVNAMGTINLLEALRDIDHLCPAVFVTTDKCYENQEWEFGYRETDPLGGYDPYSSSKAAAEIAIGAYRRSFFRNHPVRIASARSGNVIGGGDWAQDRILPDCIRALQSNLPIEVRNKSATRPWQHVLEPLSGYLCLAALLAGSEKLAMSFNFGPRRESNLTVGDLVEEVLKHWPGTWADRSNPAAMHEAGLLHLAIDRSETMLGWKPIWDFSKTIEHTLAWYRLAATASQVDLRSFTINQIFAYIAEARKLGVWWTIFGKAAPENQHEKQP